jgi:tripartite-type tricarboxylate transporter receptor subunit TctC
MNRSLVAALVVVALLPWLPGPAAAQSGDAWPVRPVRVVVPFAPGGALDTVARAVSQRLAERLGQPVVVENKPGAANVIGMEAVARAAPDGYTLLFAAAPLALNVALGVKQPFDPLKDFAPVSLVASIPGVVLVNPATPHRSLKDLVDAARARPGGLDYATAGAGSMPHLIGEALRAKTGATLNHIGYKGSVPALQDTIAGTIDVLFDAWIPSGPQIAAGRLRAIAVTSAQRSPLMPEVPTVVEQGFPELVGAGFYGLLAPAGTPAPIVQRLHASVLWAVRETDLGRRLVEQGFEVHASTPLEYAAYVRREIERWTPVVRAAGVKPGN